MRVPSANLPVSRRPNDVRTPEVPQEVVSQWKKERSVHVCPSQAREEEKSTFPPKKMMRLMVTATSIAAKYQLSAFRAIAHSTAARYCTSLEVHVGSEENQP